MASQLKSGAPTYGQMYELYVIAAVVVGMVSSLGWILLSSDTFTKVYGLPAEDAITPFSQPGIVTADPKLRNTRWEPNPDPRPVDGSHVFTPGASASAPSEGFFDTDALYHGAFAEDLWTEEWTRFGDESWYTQP